MKITLNGDTIQLKDTVSIQTLLEQQHLATHKVATELNQTLIPRSHHHLTYLKDGDHLEIVHAIGGG